MTYNDNAVDFNQLFNKILQNQKLASLENKDSRFRILFIEIFLEFFLYKNNKNCRFDLLASFG